MENPLASFGLWSSLFGGLALFLFGMEITTQALKSAAGDYLKDILGRLTRNRFVGLGAGTLVTAVIQSSSVTTVLLVGFISAGLMTLPQSVAVIIGANIGTTITAQILAFNITALALPMVAVGFLMTFTTRNEIWKEAGQSILGLGLVFYGMGLMGTAMNPLRDYQPFIQFMVSLQNPLLAAGVGALFTAVIQSSSATTGILIALASQGLIGLEAAIPLAMGANIGTCVTAILASIGKPREAIRAAVVHTLFNVIGVLVWIAFVPQLAELARWMSPAAEGLSGAQRLAAETPRQIANIHTFFNVANALLFIGFTNVLARAVVWLVPDRPVTPIKAMLPKYLDKDLLPNPSVALEAARSELDRLGKRVRKMLADVMPTVISGTRRELQELASRDKVVDALHYAIIEYLGQISLEKLSRRQSGELMQLITIANGLEQIGDRIATAMVTSAGKRIDEGVNVSERTALALTQYHEMVVETLDEALKAVSRQDRERARQVRKRKKDFVALSKELAAYGLERLTANEPNRLKTYAREMELMEILESIFTIARRIARTEDRG